MSAIKMLILTILSRLEPAASKNVRQVLDDLMLRLVSQFSRTGSRWRSHSMLFDSAWDNFAILIHTDGARDENQTSGLDGVREYIWERIGNLVGYDCLSLC